MNIEILKYILMGLVFLGTMKLVDVYYTYQDLKRAKKEQYRKNIETLKFAIRNGLDVIEDRA